MPLGSIYFIMVGVAQLGWWKQFISLTATTTLRLTNLRTYPGAWQDCVVTNPANSRLNLSYQYQNNGNISQITDAMHSDLLPPLSFGHLREAYL